MKQTMLAWCQDTLTRLWFLCSLLIVGVMTPLLLASLVFSCVPR